MEKVKIVKISHFEKDKNNNVYTGKWGNYAICRLVVIHQGQEKNISGAVKPNGETYGWKVGDEVQVELVQKGDFLNFRLPSKNITRQEFDNLKYQISKLEMRIEALEKPIDQQVEEVFGEEPVDYEPPV